MTQLRRLQFLILHWGTASACEIYPLPLRFSHICTLWYSLWISSVHGSYWSDQDHIKSICSKKKWNRQFWNSWSQIKTKPRKFTTRFSMFVPALIFLPGRFYKVDIHLWGNCCAFWKFNYVLESQWQFAKVTNATIISSLDDEDVYFFMSSSYFVHFLLNLFNVSAISTVSLMSSDLYFSPQEDSKCETDLSGNRHFNILSFDKSLYNKS